MEQHVVASCVLVCGFHVYKTYGSVTSEVLSGIFTLLVFSLGYLLLKLYLIWLWLKDPCRRFVYRNIPNCCIMLGRTCSTILWGIFPYSCPFLRSIRIVLPMLIWLVRCHIYTIALLIDFCAASISPCDRTQFHLLGRTFLLTNRNIAITDTTADTCK